MKSLIILALLAFAVNSFSLNFTAASLGEATTLGLTPEEIQTIAMPCINALNNDLAQGLALLETGDIVTIITGVSSWFTQFQTDVEVTCKSYMTEVEEVLMAKISVAQPIPITLEENLKKFAPEILQQAAALINNVIQGNDYEAGVNDATIGMILYGLITPTTLPNPKFNMSLYVPFNQEEFVSQYFNAFFSEIGSNEWVNNTELNQCITQIESTVDSLKTLIGGYNSVGFTQNVNDLSAVFTTLASTVENCSYGAQLYMSVMEPVFQAFMASPVDFVLQAANNVASNAPELWQSIQQEEVYTMEGQYEMAGMAKGQRFMTVFGFVNFY